ncbi:DsbA family protein [Staphylococcus agnetis]|uniref:DsbA family protein n=1 Tax=Staphylococcus agnetis TaxID=985762 RepID=UPI00118B7FF5|nr:thioredoxin domain-containing protein [Staphylococcus agnetis]QDW97654.1 protein-disulfide isomerase [Staphylococcus agnetis]
MSLKKSIMVVVVVSLFILASAGIFKTYISKNSAQTIDDVKAFHKDTLNNPTAGQSNKVILTEFGDYKCPYCGDFEKDIKPKLKKDYIDTNKVEFRYVNVLLHDKESMRGTRAALTVHRIAPKAYWDFHDYLYAQQPHSKKAVSKQTWLTDDLIKKGVNQLNISPEQKQAIIQAYQAKTDASLTQAKADHHLFKKYQVKQVPALYVNGKRVEDITDYQSVKQAIDAALREDNNSK